VSANLRTAPLFPSLIWLVSGPLHVPRAQSSLGGTQYPFVRHPQAGQRKEYSQISRFLRLPSVAHFREAKLALEHPKQMFYIGPEVNFRVFQLVDQSAIRAGLVRCFALARHHRDVPVRPQMLVFGFLALVRTAIARVGKDIHSLTVQQLAHLCHVIRIGWCGHHRVHQTRFGVHADVRLQPKVPSIAFPYRRKQASDYLGIARTGAVLGRRRCGDDRGVHCRAGAQHQPLARQQCIHGLEDSQAQFVLFEQMTEAQGRALIRQAIDAYIQARKLSIQRYVVKRLFHDRIGQAEPMLQKMNAPHRFHGKGRASILGAKSRCVRRDDCQQFRLGHDRLHLAQEYLLVRVPHLQLEAVRGGKPGSVSSSCGCFILDQFESGYAEAPWSGA